MIVALKETSQNSSAKLCCLSLERNGNLGRITGKKKHTDGNRIMILIFKRYLTFKSAYLNYSNQF